MAAVTETGAGARALRALALEAGAPGLAGELEALERRSREGRFYVALVGQFKRGKSTLVNALLETDLLPTGVPPVTSVVTLVRWGRVARATVVPRHAAPAAIPLSAVRDYVTEAGNPGNARAVRAVEIEWPARLLESGLCLVDTPGVGSIITANAAETHEFVPHVDAALVVLGVDPPITAAELELVRSLAAEGPPIIVVLNKVDHLRPEELEAGAAFTRRALGEHLAQDPLVLAVSGRAAREGRALPDGRARGGIDDLRGALEGLARSAGAELARTALERGTERVRRTLERMLALERRALVEPGEALAQLERALAERRDRVQTFLDDFTYRLRGELDRFRAALEARRDEFIEAMAREAPARAREAVAAVSAHSPAARLAAVAERVAWHQLETRLLAWEGELLAWVDARQRAIGEQFTGEAAQLLADVGAAAHEILGEVPLPEAPAPRFAPSARYYFAPDPGTLAMDVSGLVARLVAVVLPRAAYRARVARGLAVRVAAWARHNATRVTSAIALAAEDAKRGFETEIAEAVARLAEVVEGAVARARARRAEGAAAVAAQVARLDELLARCREAGTGAGAGAEHSEAA
jgi:GTP-binding protein EngB required for normal cell division